MIDKYLNFKYIIRKFGDNPALIWPGGELTYHQYFQYINNVSIALKKEGVQSGSIVSILSDIHHHFPILFFAILISGGIVVPINPKFPTKKIHSVIKEIDCDLIISFDESFSNNPQNKIKVLSGPALFEKSSETVVSENISSLKFEQEATIVFTSGTLGKPKGVLHTIGNHYYSALGSNENIPLNCNDCWMITLPFYHIAGISILFRTLITGAACFILDSAKDILHHIKNYNLTHLSLVSTQFYRWISEDAMTDSAKSLKAILLGGSQIPLTLIEQALQRLLPVYASYGSTEMSSQITTTSGMELQRNPISSGKILSHRELKINDEGEILVRGKTLGLGYFSGKGLIKFVDENGWFHTGDFGHIDDHQNLIVSGRRDNMFISGGENIYPEEIEQQLQCHNQIMDVCVVDIQDDEFGTRPLAFVKLKGKDKIDESKLKEYLEDKLASFKIPVRFIPWPEKLVSLKPDRNYFRELSINFKI